MYPLDYTSSTVYSCFLLFIPSLSVFLSGSQAFSYQSSDQSFFLIYHLPATGFLILNENLWLLLALAYVPFGPYLLNLFYLETFSSSLGKWCSVFVLFNISYKLWYVNIFFEFFSFIIFISIFCVFYTYFSEYYIYYSNYKSIIHLLESLTLFVNILYKHLMQSGACQPAE